MKLIAACPDVRSLDLNGGPDVSDQGIISFAEAGGARHVTRQLGGSHRNVRNNDAAARPDGSEIVSPYRGTSLMGLGPPGGGLWRRGACDSRVRDGAMCE